MNALPAGAVVYRYINVIGPNNPATNGACNGDIIMGRLIIDGGVNIRTRSAIAHINSGLPAFAANAGGEPSCHCVHSPGYVTVVWIVNNNTVVAEGIINNITPEDIIAAILTLSQVYKCWGGVVKGFVSAASIVFGHPLGPDILQRQASRTDLWGRLFPEIKKGHSGPSILEGLWLDLNQCHSRPQYYAGRLGPPSSVNCCLVQHWNA